MTRDDAARFWKSTRDVAGQRRASEADRYAYRMPGQATAYYYAIRSWMALRTEGRSGWRCLRSASLPRCGHRPGAAVSPADAVEAVMAALSVH
ncbi:MAG: hypothetical protein H6994_00775 [Pseudomonadales bacterium]|nr:hypothetical protein [Pseudomonadales bacterium]